MTGMDFKLRNMTSAAGKASSDIRTATDLDSIHQVPDIRLLKTVSPHLLGTQIRHCEVLRDQGKDILSTPEDSLAVAPGRMGGALRFAVADGVSGAYTTPPGPSKIRGVSGGRGVSEAFAARVRYDGGRSNLQELLALAYDDAAIVNRSVNPPYTYGDLSTWAGTTGAILEVRGEVFNWVVWGDSRLLIEDKRGNTYITPDGLEKHEHDVEPVLQGMIQRRMEAGLPQAQARGEAWKEYMPIFRQTRRERINSTHPCSFALLNGTPEFLSSRDILRGNGLVSALRRAVLFTDGCILRSECNLPETAPRVLGLVKSGGLRALIEDTRAKERAGATLHSHVTHAEAVGISLEFK
jgi:hypothetical protein